MLKNMKKEKVIRVTEKEKEIIELLRDGKKRDALERMLLFTIMESEETMKLFEDNKDFCIYKECAEHKEIAEIVKRLIS